MKGLRIRLAGLFCLLLFSCGVQNKQVKQIKLRSDIETLLDSIIKVCPPNEVYELYIDKIDPHNSNILFYIGSASLIEKEQVIALCQIELNHKDISIYSGLEKYISSGGSKVRKENGTSRQNEVYWAIEDRDGKINNYQMDFAYPFMPFPLKNEENTFSKPNIKKNN